MQPHHDRAGERVEKNFLGRAGLEARAAGNRFAARVERDADLGQGDDRRIGIVRRSDRERTRRAPSLQCTEHKRRRPGSRETDDHVIDCGCDGTHIGCPLRAVVLGSFDRFEQRLPPACEQRDDPVLRPGKRRPKLHTVEEAESAGSAGTGVNEPAARSDARRGRINRARDLGRGSVNHICREDLVFGEGADEFGRGVKIEIRVPAAGGFRVKHR